MNQKYKEEKQETEDDSFDAGFTIPDSKPLLTKLEESYKSALRQEHKIETEENEKKGKKENKKAQRRGGAICCCGHPSCRIGPFVERA